MKRQINMNLHNDIYHSVEEGINILTNGLGIGHKEFNDRCDANEELKRDESLPNSYFLYQDTCSYVISEILRKLDIEFDEKGHENYLRLLELEQENFNLKKELEELKK